jgi:hypothetical protein
VWVRFAALDSYYIAAGGILDETLVGTYRLLTAGKNL